ncbi:MAG: hypothetical protein H6667_06385 [Ardenticatenaceae bacterium]|nr:hypothetical protein [Ardenticatenaceae bacterium]MCB9442808.1 hypothetical protein [Ardenticatenaceae bacterium]
MRKAILFLIVFVLLLVAPTAVRYLQFYDLNAEERVPPPPYDPEAIKAVPTPEGSEFVDNPETMEGLVLLDQAHDNNFTLEDIAYLDGRLAARGVEMLPFDGGDLSQALRTINAFIVITPLSEFAPDEILAVRRFVDRGGRLLLVGDPTRFSLVYDEEDFFGLNPTLVADQIPLNSLANEFDIAFNSDYLYNTVENEGNFRNIILRGEGFAENGLVDGVDKLAFYSTHSLQVGPTGEALITADDNTWSSTTDRPGRLVLAAASQDGQVLALGDIHFMTQPYFTVYDNGRFIAQIADFLAQSTGRRLVLADFPYFFHSPVNLVYTGGPELGPDAFDEIIALQEAFRRVDRDLLLAAEPQDGADVLYLGLYNQAGELGKLLEENNITFLIDPPIEEETLAEEQPEETETETIEAETAVRLIQSNLGDIQMSGTALILLDESEVQRRVIILAASNEGLGNTVNRLINLIPLNADYALSDCLIQDNLALCPSNVADEVVEYELDTSGAPGIPPAAEPTPTPEPEEPGTGGDELPGLTDAIPQGPIALGETVTGTLADGESHAWTFSEGPVMIDVVLSGAELDGVFEIYGPDGELLTVVDNGISGEDEVLQGFEVPDDGEYTIVVRDYFYRVADYSLTVTLAE